MQGGQIGMGPYSGVYHRLDALTMELSSLVGWIPHAPDGAKLFC